MSNQLLSFQTDAETEILVEILSAEDGYDTYRGPAERVAAKAQKSFDATLDSLKLVTQKVVNKLTEIKNSPDEVTLELGIKINAEADVVLTKVGGETHMNLTLKWKKAPPTPQEGGNAAAPPAVS